MYCSCPPSPPLTLLESSSSIRDGSVTGVFHVTPEMITPTSALTLQVKANEELRFTNDASVSSIIGCKFPGSIEKCKLT